MSQNESAAMAAPQGPCYSIWVGCPVISYLWNQWLHHACPSSKFISDLLLKKGTTNCWLLRKLQAQAQSIKTLPTLTTYHIQQGYHIYLVVFQEGALFLTCGGYIWLPSSYRSMRQQLRRPGVSRFRTWMIQSIGGKANNKPSQFQKWAAP